MRMSSQNLHVNFSLLRAAHAYIEILSFRLDINYVTYNCLCNIEICMLGPKKKGLCFRLHNQKNWSRSVGKTFFFAFFFYFEKFVSDKLQANLESVGVPEFFFFRHQYELSRDL